MENFELKFTDENNILRVREEKDGLIVLAVNDRDEPGRPNVITLTKDQAKVLCSHILCLVR